MFDGHRHAASILFTASFARPYMMSGQNSPNGAAFSCLKEIVGVRNLIPGELSKEGKEGAESG